jgi:hypothetical protein
LDSILRDEKKYNPNWKNNTVEVIIPDFHIGYFDNTPIFRLYDNLFHDSLLIIEKSSIINGVSQTGEINLPFELNGSFKTSFIDLSINGPNLEEMVANPPIWLAEEFKDRANELRLFLQKKVWIRILKKTGFQVKVDAKCYLYEIKM